MTSRIETKEPAATAGAATPRPWQQSAFVDGPRYAQMPDDWKAMRQAEEVRIVRGPGRLGSPECNPVLRVEWNPADAALIVEAVNDYDRLRAIEAAARDIADRSPTVVDGETLDVWCHFCDSMDDKRHAEHCEWAALRRSCDARKR